MRGRVAIYLTLVSCCVGFSACGENNKEKPAVKRAVERLYTALATKDAAGVCNSLSKQGRKELAKVLKGPGGSDCKSAFEFGLAFAGGKNDSAQRAKVTKVDVKGDRANAQVTYRGKPGRVGLVKENGRWKLSGLSLK